jgi:site-specific DNA-methyltransferase (adenine-specific)
VIYADPGWRYSPRNNPKTRFGCGTTGRYTTMTTSEIAALPVASRCAKDCILYLWATGPKLSDALLVLKAWGFRYSTWGFTWIKTNRKNGKFFFGVGHHTKHNVRFV